MNPSFAQSLVERLSKSLENDSTAEKANSEAAHGDPHPDSTASAPVPAVEPATAKTVSATVESSTDEGDVVDDYTEVANSKDECEVVSRETSELASAINGLESIFTAIEAYPEGMDERASHLANLACEAYVGPWNLGASLVPSTESFSGSHSRKHANSVALENIGETLKQAYAYVKELLAKAIEAIKAFLAKVFDRAEWLIRSSTALKTKAASLTGSPTEANVQLGHLAGRISIQGKVPANPHDVFAKVEGLFSLAEETDKIVEAMENEAADLFSKVGADASFIDNLTAATEQEIKVPAHFKKLEDGSWSTEVFPGEVRYTAKKAEGAANMVLKGFGAVLYGREHGKEGPASAEQRTLSPAEIVSTAEAAGKFAHSAQIARNSLKLNGDQAVKRMIAALGNGNGSVTDASSVAVQRLVRQKAQQIQAARYSCAQMFADAISAAIAAVKIAELSAKQYKGAGVPAAATPAEGAAA